jgi:hypothetical protein
LRHQHNGREMLFSMFGIIRGKVSSMMLLMMLEANPQQ